LPNPGLAVGAFSERLNLADRSLACGERRDDGLLAGPCQSDSVERVALGGEAEVLAGVAPAPLQVEGAFAELHPKGRAP